MCVCYNDQMHSVECEPHVTIFQHDFICFKYMNDKEAWTHSNKPTHTHKYTGHCEQQRNEEKKLKCTAAT